MPFYAFLRQNFIPRKPLTRVLVQKNKLFFAKFCNKFLAFSAFFQYLAQKILKKHILTSIWSAQYAGQNIQHCLPWVHFENLSHLSFIVI